MFFCPRTDISVTVPPIGVKFCIMVELHPRCVYSGGDIIRDLEMPVKKGFCRPFLFSGTLSNLTVNFSKTVSRSIL